MPRPSDPRVESRARDRCKRNVAIALRAEKMRKENKEKKNKKRFSRWEEADELVQRGIMSKRQEKKKFAEDDVRRRSGSGRPGARALAGVRALGFLGARAPGRPGARASGRPGVRVKGLIQDMIKKLENEANAAATEKAYCDEQMAKTEAKKSELEDDVAKLTAKIDTKSAKSAELKGDVKELQEELAALAREKAEMDKVREAMHAAFVSAQADLKLGLQGLSKGLSKLRKYYQGEDAALLQTDDDQPAKPVFHKKSSGAGGSIIDILEVCQSDFAKELATIEQEEADQAEAYEKRAQEIAEATALKGKDVQYKTQEFKGLDTEVDELSNDRGSTDEELSAVLEYFAKVKERCIAKPESYEERKARRAAEISGLETSEV
ncbi:unnamed protein product [Prorocentrum cordatum]|uniref:Uncharacterized protein n=1 Tax=Prorocentrum cordatum TaxID=2364126 RepID=A0ABN9U4Z2_9DINO|nr:unnamed protein product [Polarella glacialis]